MRKCSRRGCTHRVRNGYLMCVGCWRQVPKAIRDQVWLAAKGGSRHDRLVAVRRAIESLAPLAPVPPTPAGETGNTR